MLQRNSLLFLCLFAPFAFAQLDSNSVTVTATNNVNLQPDQAVFQVSVNSDTTSTLSDVLTAVQPAGLGLSNFSSVGTPFLSVNQTGLQWTFGLAAPLAQIQATIAMLSALQQSVPQANPRLSVSFSIQGTQVSQQSQQSQTCSYADLLASARAQAQTLAAAAGRTLSGILAMSSTTAKNTGSIPSLASYLSATPQACSLTVKFALLGL